MLSSADSKRPQPASPSGTAPRRRKQPEERRAEILDAASRLAMLEGLERITLRAVADRLGVRPGLITHYFPAAEDLVVAAFELAVTGERSELLPESGDPLENVATLVHRVQSGAADELARLWLNARHLSRFVPALADAVEQQEFLDRERLTELIERGIAAGEFSADDAATACIRIFMAIDGFSAYVNDREPFEHEAFTDYVSHAVCRELGVPSERLQAARVQKD